MKNSRYLDVYGLSVRGSAHNKNHDHFAIATLNKSMRLHQSNLTIDDDSRVHGHNQGHLFLVADGIGGGPSPSRASGTAVDSVVQYFLNEMPWYHLADGQPEDVTLALEDALQNAQSELLNRARPGEAGLGTTMTLAFVFWPHLYIAHVGDSRCYLKRGKELRKLTTDHTLAEVRKKVDGTVTERSKHMLWNAVGGLEEQLFPEVKHLVLQPGNVLALVTDGVTRNESESELLAALKRGEAAEPTCDALVGRSGQDDRTAIVARFLPHAFAGAATAPAASPPQLDAHRELPAKNGTPTGCQTPRRSRVASQSVPAFAGA